MQVSLAFIVDLVTGPEIIALVSMMTANVVLSILAAIKNNEFCFRKLGDFVTTRFLPLLSYLVVAGLASVVGDWAVAAVAVYITLVAMYSAGILAALKALTGISIPGVFTEKK